MNMQCGCHIYMCDTCIFVISSSLFSIINYSRKAGIFYILVNFWLADPSYIFVISIMGKHGIHMSVTRHDKIILQSLSMMYRPVALTFV
ncbi:hypothetical protein EB796_006067 [Bugula neritina]|uniref:Uncharacterized protein n=1 Tax=Bugula neritina TaxID=10212 RepID=A0A7J7KBH5_BUGNE|nr:hypothetical protein EB796_006067 [Bugula neritina]